MTKSFRIAVGLCVALLVALMASAVWGPYAAKQRFEATMGEVQKPGR